MHAFWFLPWASFYIYLHWISDDILSPIIQSLSILSLTARGLALWLTLEEQTSKSSTQLHFSSMNQPWHKLVWVLRPPGVPRSVTCSSHRWRWGFLTGVKHSGNAPVPHRDSKGSLGCSLLTCHCSTFTCTLAGRSPEVTEQLHPAVLPGCILWVLQLYYIGQKITDWVEGGSFGWTS